MNATSSALAEAPASGVSESTPPPSTPSTRVSRVRSEQSQSVANAIAEASRLIQTALTTPAVGIAVAQFGYGPDELAAGQALAASAQAKFAARQSAVVHSVQLRVERDAAFEMPATISGPTG